MFKQQLIVLHAGFELDRLDVVIDRSSLCAASDGPAALRVPDLREDIALELHGEFLTIDVKPHNDGGFTALTHLGFVQIAGKGELDFFGYHGVDFEPSGDWCKVNVPGSINAVINA